MELYDKNSKSNQTAEIPITTYHFDTWNRKKKVDMKIFPISYKFKSKTAIYASPKYIFTPNHWAHESIWYEFQD